MKLKNTETVKYFIKPRYKQILFGIFGEKKVYDLFKTETGSRWCDPSYGNGGGDFMDFEETSLIKTFDLFMDADTFKRELENVQ